MRGIRHPNKLPNDAVIIPSKLGGGMRILSARGRDGHTSTFPGLSEPLFMLVRYIGKCRITLMELGLILTMLEFCLGPCRIDGDR